MIARVFVDAPGAPQMNRFERVVRRVLPGATAALLVALATFLPAADARDNAGIERRQDTSSKTSSKHRAPHAAPGEKQDEAAQPPPAPVLVRDATIWTETGTGPDSGILEHADLLVVGGKIERIGRGLGAPKGARVIDAGGKHVTPGIVDCHSHTAIDGDVNEATHNVTAEVRIGDVVDWEDVNIYRQLAGGTTTVNALHGSANSIGGQNAILRWKWGRPAAELRFAGAPEGIKFALGENPKQSNWGEGSDRYPKSRMGVEESIRAAFRAARDNRAAWERERGLEKKTEHAIPPRRDLQLEALQEILDGKRFVHSHCYRQDEILMLIRLAESEGFHVRTFQHVLEGYKVADEIAAHGAGGSTFADWWAYKAEAYDAIPYNATLMTRRGVLSSVNSDSNELARHLNLEAAKSMKYGGLSPTEALALATINPAKQLGIDDRVGSLAPGKDADFVIWNGDPLSVYSRVESTWIEGVKYFDREEDLAKRATLEAERAALIAKIKNPPKDTDGPPKTNDESGGREGRQARGRSAAEGTGDAAQSVAAEGASASSGDAAAYAKTAPGAERPPAPIVEAQVGPAFTAPVPRPVPAEGPVVAFTGATVHTVSGADIPNGTVIVRGGRIAAVGGSEVTIPADAARVALAGKHLYPSMIDANTTLGLIEIGSVRGTVDTNETGKINPDIRAEVAVNPSSEAIPVTRANGILVALTVPGGALLTGTSALVRLDGWTWEDMTVRAPVGMHIVWPRVTVPTGGNEPKKTEEDIRREKEEALRDLKTALTSARAYWKAKQAASAGKATAPETDTRWEAMIPLLQGKIPAIVSANDLRQIKDAVEWAEKEKIPLIIEGGRDAWRVAELLAKKHVPVILGPVLSVPSREDEPYDAAYANAAKLREAGVLFAFSAGGASNVRILPYQAGMAAAFGLPKEEALRGVTLYPARILGVEDRLGSIEVGKDATLIATDGDPLEIRTQVLRAWIDGREISLDNRHKQLYEKYKNRPVRTAAVVGGGNEVEGRPAHGHH